MRYVVHLSCNVITVCQADNNTKTITKKILVYVRLTFNVYHRLPFIFLLHDIQVYMPSCILRKVQHARYGSIASRVMYR